MVKVPSIEAEATPFDGVVTEVIENGSPSGSLSFDRTSMFTEVSTGVVVESSFATGGLFTAAISG